MTEARCLLGQCRSLWQVPVRSAVMTRCWRLSAAALLLTALLCGPVTGQTALSINSDPSSAHGTRPASLPPVRHSRAVPALPAPTSAVHNHTSVDYLPMESGATARVSAVPLLGGRVFRLPGGGNWSRLLLDSVRSELLVGGREALVRLSASDLAPLRVTRWPADPLDRRRCRLKGQPEPLCANFVTVLHAHGRRVLACATNAFAPVCAWRRLGSLGVAGRVVSGLGAGPYSPLHPSTSVLTAEGDLFAATPADFAGADVALWGAAGGAGTDRVRSAPHDGRWLTAPRPVAAVSSGGHVYMVLTEAGSGCAVDRPVITVVRLCAADVRRPARGRLWRAFRSVQLTCRLPDERGGPVLGGAAAGDLKDGVLYVAVSAAPLAGSAVCRYNMTDVDAALDGPHLTPAAETERNATTEQCSDSPAPVETFHRMAETVKPTGVPLALSGNQSWKLVAADSARVGTDTVRLLFTVSEQGELRKTRLSADGTSCRLDEYNIFEALDVSRSAVRSLVLDTDGHAVFIGTDAEVVRLPAARCHLRRSEEACLSSGDPHCGWSGRRCVLPPSGGGRGDTGVWEQSAAAGCGRPGPSAAGWSHWSAWEVCGRHDAVPLTCRCRRPALPRHQLSGRLCAGVRVRGGRRLVSVGALVGLFGLLRPGRPLAAADLRRPGPGRRRS